MCFDTDSRPPIVPIAGGALEAGTITLTSEDGTGFSAFRAVAAKPSGARILILPDVRGLHRYYEELALRYAEHGIDALAIDYFARTAGTGNRGDDFDYMPHVSQTRWQTLAIDIRAGVAALRSGTWDASRHDGGTIGPPSGGREPIRTFTTGFCMGGRLAFLTATLGLELAGVIGFYGWPTGPSRNGTPAPAEAAATMTGQVLAIYGGADEGIGPEVRDRFDAALDGAGVQHRTIVYPGAPHSFFDRKAEAFADASAAAWSEVLAFIGATMD